MHYGIMEMQISMLVPGGADPLAQLGSLSHAGLVGRLADAGFNLIELGGDLLLFFPQFFSEPAIEELAQLKFERGLSFTVHLPLWSVEPSTPLTPVREGSVRALAQVIQATRPLDPECYVLHATGALAAEFTNMRIPDTGKTLLMRLFQNGARQSLQTLLSETGIPSRKLAIETIEFPLDLNLELAEELDLSICLDTGHILAGFSGPIALPEALNHILPRLGEIHLHDAPWQGPEYKKGYGTDHQALGRGDLDVPYLLNRLKAANWNGPIIFELTLPEALESVQRIQSLSM